MRKKLSRIFLILGLDTISENQNRFVCRVDLSHWRIEIELAGQANQFAVRSFVRWAKRLVRRSSTLREPRFHQSADTGSSHLRGTRTIRTNRIRLARKPIGTAVRPAIVRAINGAIHTEASRLIS